MAQNQLLFIDKSYKSDMEEFLRIRNLCKDTVTKSLSKAHIVSEWKSHIRDRLIVTKKTFN